MSQAGIIIAETNPRDISRRTDVDPDGWPNGSSRSGRNSKPNSWPSTSARPPSCAN
jgi:hypothetical protein